MNAEFYRISFLAAFLVFLLTGCRQDQPSAEKPAVDTRDQVKAAYARINYMAVPYTFNLERLAILQQQLTQEQDAGKKINLSVAIAFELLKCGKLDESITAFDGVFQVIRQYDIKLKPEVQRNLLSLYGVTHLRKGEVDNCVLQHNHESCFLPIQGGGIHTAQAGSRKAIEVFTQLLKEFPDDLETRYLLNVAYQTVGEYPDGVPAAYRIPASWFESPVAFPRFREVAGMLGVNTKSLAGGAVVDDFNNDGWLDIVQTSWSPRESMVLFINNGDGTFSDRTAQYGLEGQVGILNLTQTDFNNDGWLDLLLLRGAWYGNQGDIPSTLLMNTGQGGFRDVTASSGLLHAAACQNASWADYNLDGWLDVAMGNESRQGYARGINLFINNGDGTFSEQAAAWGLSGSHFIKGSTATDVNNDGYPDLYFSTIDTLNLLYINQGAEGKTGFRNISSPGNGGLPMASFPCWSFDVDNDGNEDLFSSAFNNDGTPATLWMKSHMGKADPAWLPKLYKNHGDLRFEEVGSSMGLNEVAFTMGCNYGDINLDGYLDFYLGTGNPAYQSLVPNKMYLNLEGKSFADVSYAGGFANVQKGHGAGFGDLDHDGDEDLYVQIGGSFDGDGYYNCLFENPNYEDNHWLVLKLVGTKANRPAIGARVTITVSENGQERKLYRTVSYGSSFGGNSLALETGLRKATEVRSVEVRWPCKDCPVETFTGLMPNMAYHLKQGAGRADPMPYEARPFRAGEHEHMHH